MEVYFKVCRITPDVLGRTSPETGGEPDYGGSVGHEIGVWRVGFREGGGGTIKQCGKGDEVVRCQRMNLKS